MNNNIHWKRLDRRPLVDTRFIKVYEDTLELPNGTIIDDYTVAELPDGVVIVATDDQDRLLTQFEYKYAIDKTILNLPSGSVEDGLSILEVASKELLEETGYFSEDLELIGTLYEYPSKLSHTISIVRARNARKVKDSTHELTETISPVHLIDLEMDDFGGVFDTTYTVSAIALTLPAYLRKNNSPTA
jgi:ADP-ribose pyrophosphatase